MPLLPPFAPPVRGPLARAGGLGLRDVARVAGLLALTSVIGLGFADVLGETRLTLLYILPVLAAAGMSGVWAGCLAAVGAVGLMNLLFAAPRYSFVVADAQDLLTLVMFFPVAVTTGALAGRLREQRDTARAHNRALHILSAASDRLRLADDPDSIIAITRAAMADLTGAEVRLVTRAADGTLVPDQPLKGADLYAAETALARGQTEIAAASGWNGATYSFLPVTVAEGGLPENGAPDTAQADLAFGLARDEGAYAGERLSAADILRRHCALALQRLRFARKAESESARAALHALRADLLGSLSHDLRSPLAGILGSVTTLKDFGAALPPPARADLLAGIESETRRLSAYVANLLQLTRLQSGTPPALAPVSGPAALRAAAARIRAMWPDGQIDLQLAETPPFRADAGLVEQAVFNLMDNAMRHAGGAVSVDLAAQEGQVRITISDAGRLWDGPAPAPGSGLGLHICAAIATACGGTMTTRPNGPHGRAVTLSFPAESPTP